MRYFADYIKGKPYQKTVLWENSSPTSDFGDVTVELSETMNNYDQLMFVYQTTKTSNDPISVIMSVSDFKKTNWGSSVGDYRLFIGGMPVSNTNESRLVARVDDTHIRFYYAYTYAGASNSTYIIPLKIIGIKRGLGEQGFKKGTLTWSEFTETGANGEHKIVVGIRPKKIIWYFPNTCFLDTYYEEVSTTYFVGNTLITSGNYSWQKLGLKAGQNPWWLNLQSVDDTGFTLGYKDYIDWSDRILFWEAWG